MQLPIHPNDIPVLAKIFNPNTQYILIAQKQFDKNIIKDVLECQIIPFESPLFLKETLKKYPAKNCTLINPLPNQSFSKDLTLLQIGASSYPVTSRHWINSMPDISKLSSEGKPLDKKTFHYINNPDKTIRWLYPAHQQQPTFLHLYNASGWKGKLIKKGIQLGFRCGLSNRIKQGTIQVYAPYAPIGGTLQKKSALFKSTNFAIFTGTKGANRKAVIVLEKNKKATHFLKVPLTHAAKRLVKNESRRLKQLEDLSFHTLVVPQARQIYDYLLQSNICPVYTLPNLTLSSTHLQGLQELYQKTTQWQLLQTTPIWASIEKDLSELKSTTIANDLSAHTVQRLVGQLQILKTQMNTTLPIPLALTHGDFTPWNTYLTQDNIMVYDWELADRMPLLYDAFHFIFQTSILVKKSPYTAIKQQVELLRQQPIIQSLQKEFSFSFDTAYQFYLLRTISYYLNRYAQQAHLHEQAHWLVDTWVAALKEVVMENTIVNY